MIFEGSEAPCNSRCVCAISVPRSKVLLTCTRPSSLLLCTRAIHHLCSILELGWSMRSGPGKLLWCCLHYCCNGCWHPALSSPQARFRAGSLQGKPFQNDPCAFISNPQSPAEWTAERRVTLEQPQGCISSVGCLCRSHPVPGPAVAAVQTSPALPHP